MPLDEPTDRRRRRTWSAVLDAARTVFSTSGYRAASIESLSTAADVAVSTIYTNFPDGKADVYLALARRTADEHAEAMRGTSHNGPAAALDAYIDFHREHPLALRLLALSDVSPGDSSSYNDVRAYIDDVLAGIATEMVRSARAAGSDVDARGLVLYAWSAINGAYALFRRGTVDAAELDGILDLCRADVSRHLAGGAA
ncbi:TetR/AcrR family transcriptional regulator [Rhodococcus triatomae]|uniref:DNA-binding transcriptional regulator, AcrR family n=1 Tax=Rhodococcus triatomae TaxID=300028 RepID=A0A1G8IH39_9NOCA|nr:TetR/AcrR family transcriptional regulator [Rhodococcus triatomae]QNG21054.1 TetR/AcrR family transcriptional regulator [Rhodococcus triatomae]QNG23032.1 TetR/AcrR family transcriptional regulator [Rhodococcus triatomae]SDI18107.1 DNA-binding transcriptional regulator, AcrR family [Rhodococcus triatomae]